MEPQKLYLSLTSFPKDLTQLKIGNKVYFYNQIDQAPFLLSSVCPHMGNEVIQNSNGDLHCPVHGWNFDSSGKCTNVSNRQLEKYPIKQDEKGYFVLVNDKIAHEKHLDHSLSLTNSVSFKLVAHACLEIKIGDDVIYTDPWFKGTAFLGSWYPYPKPNTRGLISNPKAIFITHEHSDHLHPDSLAEFNKETLVFFPDFPNKRIQRILQKAGFNNIKALTFGCEFVLSDQISVTCFEPESVWNDSIQFFKLAGLNWLNLNDAGLNQRLAKKLDRVDMVSSTFSFGASGFPLTWTNFSDEEKIEMMQRSNLGRIEQIRTSMKLYKASYFMPFASHFSFWHPSHMHFLNIARRNTVDTISKAFEEEESFEVIDLLPGESWNVNTEKVTYIYKYRSVFYDKDNIRKFVSSTFSDAAFKEAAPELSDKSINEEGIKNYFLRLNQTPEIHFCENIVAQFQISDFNYEANNYLFYLKIENGSLHFGVGISPIKSNVSITIPQDIFNAILLDNLSWDEAFIGYWCRFHRDENIYHTGFWRLLQAPYYLKSNVTLYSQNLVNTEDNIATLISGNNGELIESILNRYGLYCGACHKSTSETIKQAASFHGLGEVETNRLIKELNIIITSES